MTAIAAMTETEEWPALDEAPEFKPVPMTDVDAARLAREAGVKVQRHVAETWEHAFDRVLTASGR